MIRRPRRSSSSRAGLTECDKKPTSQRAGTVSCGNNTQAAMGDWAISWLAGAAVLEPARPSQPSRSF